MESWGEVQLQKGDSGDSNETDEQPIEIRYTVYTHLVSLYVQYICCIVYIVQCTYTVQCTGHRVRKIGHWESLI